MCVWTLIFLISLDMYHKSRSTQLAMVVNSLLNFLKRLQTLSAEELISDNTEL